MIADRPDAFHPDAAGDRLLAWRQVRDLTGISRTTAWRLQNAGTFPKPVHISPGRVGWRESEVAAWTARLAPRGVRPPPRTAERTPRPPKSEVPLSREVARPPIRASRRPTPPVNQLSFDF